MYAQLVDTGVTKVQDAAEMSRRRAGVPGARRRRHQDRAQGLDAGRLPAHAVRQIQQHAHSEIVGMLPEGNWITRAPTLKRKAILMAKVQDEGGHGLYLYSAAETLGVSRDQLIDDLHAGKVKYSSIFNYPTLTWADIGAIGWLVDGAAIMNQIPLCRCSYGPYARAMIRICKEESLPPAAGLRHHDDAVPRHAGAEGDGAGRAQPLVVAVADDVRAAGCRERAQRAIGALEDQAPVERRAAPALRRPDGAAGRLPRHRACPIPISSGTTTRGHYDFGAIDWGEFHDVLKGNGPCNRERLRTRVKAWDDGAWVREAAMAHAAKKAARDAARQPRERRRVARHEPVRAQRRKIRAANGRCGKSSSARQHGLAHKHVGSLHAPDAAMAIKNARDVYTRRNEGVSIWAVRSADVVRVGAGRPGAAVRAGERQGLPASDVLPDARRSEAPVSEAT